MRSYKKLLFCLFLLTPLYGQMQYAFSNSLNSTVLGTQHNLGTTSLTGDCYDTGFSPVRRIPEDPGFPTISPSSFNVVFSWATTGGPRSGYCIVYGLVPPVNIFNITSGNGSPTGVCQANTGYIQLDAGGSYLWLCVNGAWAQQSGGGSGGGLADPGSNGPIKRTSLNVTAHATAADITGLYTSCSGTKLLAANNTCVFPAPGVLNLLEGDGAGNIIDSGVSINNVVGAVSPGVGLAHFPGGTQTATSSLLVVADIASGAKQGNASKIQLGSGATTTNDCVKYDSNGNAVDSGGPCGGGSFTGNASDPRFQMTVAGAVATMDATMSSTNPANLLGGSTVFSKTTVSTLTIASNTGSTGSVAVCAHPDGSFTYNHNISGTVITGAGDFPSTAVSASGVSCSSGVPLHILTITSVPGNFDAYVGSMDKRPVVSIPAAPTTGDGTTISCPSGICSVLTPLLLNGIVDGRAPVTITTGTTGNLGATYQSGYFFNHEATAATAVVYTLPTAAAGESYCVGNSYNGAAATTGQLSIQTSASGQFIIYSDGTLSATGGFVQSGGAAMDFACVVAEDSTHWSFHNSVGTWTKH